MSPERGPEATEGTAAAPAPEVPRLSRLQFAGILAVAVTHFLLGRGPVWERAADPRELLLTIGWSYAPIPLLVAAALAWSRRLGFRAWLLSSVEVAAVKYLLTASFMIVLWTLAGPTVKQPRPLAPRGAAVELPPAPPPTAIDPATTGAVEGLVVDGEGMPAPGALVRVTGGLDGVVFARPDAAVVVDVGRDGVAGGLRVLQAWQPLVLRSTDGRLHAVRGAGAGGRVSFNFPALVAPRERALTHALGVLRLTCAAHAHPDQRPSWLVVTDNPFTTTADEGGAFRLEGVPAGRVVLEAWTPAATGASEVDVVAGAVAAARVALAGADVPAGSEAGAGAGSGAP